MPTLQKVQTQSSILCSECEAGNHKSLVNNLSITTKIDSPSDRFASGESNLEGNQVSVIRLDWDNITCDTCRTRIEDIKSDSLVQQVELRLSPRSGFHIIISSYFHLPITRIWYLRRLWGDDGNRLVHDVLSYPAHYREVLFQRKGDWHEEPLTTYTRLDYNLDIWKETNHSKRVFLMPRPKRRDYHVKLTR